MKNIVKRTVRSGNWADLSGRVTELSSPCRLCERRCGVGRASGETGFCGVGAPRVSKFFTTYGEEPPLNPCQMLYFAGCNLSCLYCSNREFMRPAEANTAAFDPEEIAARVDRLFRAGKIRVLQILGGEPTCSLPAAVEVARRLDSEVPVVWNSDFLFTAETFETIDAFVDYYVADYKFTADCAASFCGYGEYEQVVRRNLLAVDPERLLIRQLPLRGHIECCTLPILDFIAEYLPGVPVSLNELLPDRAGCCHAPLPEEWETIERAVCELNLTRLYARYNADAPPAEENPSRFSGELILRPDGKIAVQDVPAEVRELLNTILGECNDGPETKPPVR